MDEIDQAIVFRELLEASQVFQLIRRVIFQQDIFHFLKAQFSVFVRVLIHPEYGQDRLKEDLSKVTLHDLDIGENDLFLFEIDGGEFEELNKEYLEYFG